MSYSAGILLIGTFLWNMGIYRAIPDFLGTAIKLIPTVNETVTELPKPSVTATINAITESPVAGDLKPKIMLLSY